MPSAYSIKCFTVLFLCPCGMWCRKLIQLAKKRKKTYGIISLGTSMRENSLYPDTNKNIVSWYKD